MCQLRTHCDGYKGFLAHPPEVHHIDHDPRNNAPENLQTTCKVCHSSESGRSAHEE